MDVALLCSVLPLAFSKAVPLLLAATGGLFAERTGVVNIGLEGMMLCGALAGVLGSYYTGSPWAGVAAALAAGLLAALLLALTGVSWGMDQIVSGVAINILALGVTGALLYAVFDVHGSSPSVAKLPVLSADWWAGVPLAGGFFAACLGSQSVLFFAALALSGLSWLVIYRTPLGLRMRAVGEDPSVAASCGVNVFRVRYCGVLLSGALSGLAGAYMSLGDLSQFVERMTGGRGFIALAALIFGKWKPQGVLGACFFFGFAEALAETFQGGDYGVPSQFLLMLPFVFTLLLLGGWVGEARPPAADGKPYTGEQDIA